MKFVVDTHTHTLASGHAYSTVLENAQIAAERGLALMCMTDHAPMMPGAPHFWHFVNQRVIPRQLHGVGIIRGIEANILNVKGELDVDQRLVEQLDWVIGSMHEALFEPANEVEHRQAYINAIRSGLIDVIGHPGNPNYPFELDAVIDEAIKHNVAIEINNSSLSGSRIGSEARCLEIAKRCKEKGALIATGSDAHFAHDIGNFAAVSMLLQKVNFPVELIVTRDKSAFLDFLALRGKSLHDIF